MSKFLPFLDSNLPKLNKVFLFSESPDRVKLSNLWRLKVRKPQPLIDLIPRAEHFNLPDMRVLPRMLILQNHHLKVNRRYIILLNSI